MYRRSSQLKSQLMHCALRPMLITNHESPNPKFVRIKMISLPIKYAVLPPYLQGGRSRNLPKFTFMSYIYRVRNFNYKKTNELAELHWGWWFPNFWSWFCEPRHINSHLVQGFRFRMIPCFRLRISKTAPSLAALPYLGQVRVRSPPPGIIDGSYFSPFTRSAIYIYIYIGVVFEKGFANLCLFASKNFVGQKLSTK